MPESKKPNVLLAAVLAWAIPGAGHLYVGRTVRGIILFVMIGAMFWSGVALGGIMTVDNRNERWWFIAQMNTGVHGLIGWYRSNREYRKIDTEIAERFDTEPSMIASNTGPNQYSSDVSNALHAKDLALVAPTATVAFVYAGVAGLLNLLCVFDALMLAILGRRGEPDAPDRKQDDKT